mmetsp:Transcript_35310/g.85464  ORF Transcript_35310/g.85464 Transcript_35310/m.85464 type:complete len:233 (+) Transcript_35310:146-844(+)
MKRRLFSTSAAVTAAAAAILAVSSSSPASSSILSVDAWSPFIHSPSSFFLGRHGGPTSSDMIIRMDNSNSNSNDDDTVSTGGARPAAADASAGDTDSKNHEVHETRRSFLNAAAMNICLLGGAATVAATTTVANPAPANAPEPAATAGATRYVSGKPPQIGGKPAPKPASGDVKGTRKDPDFLRSVADCRSQCQATAGPDGLSKPKEDCLSECQDICCKTYEQCTFNIVPRI